MASSPVLLCVLFYNQAGDDHSRCMHFCNLGYFLRVFFLVFVMEKKIYKNVTVEFLKTSFNRDLTDVFFFVLSWDVLQDEGEELLPRVTLRRR